MFDDTEETSPGLVSAATAAANLRSWFDGAPPGSTHMIVVTDELDWSSCPVYVAEAEDVRLRHQEEKHKPMQRVMEIYRLDYSFDKQVDKHRCFTYELPPDGYDDHVLAAAGAIADSSLEQARLSTAELVVLCRAEIARRRAAVERAAEKEAFARYTSDARQARLDRLHDSTQKDGQAAGPSPNETTSARQDVDPPGVPPAPAACPSPIEDDPEERHNLRELANELAERGARQR